MNRNVAGTPDGLSQDDIELRQETLSMLKIKRRFMAVWMLVGAAIITVAAVYLLNILSVTVAILLWTMVIVFCLRGTVDKLEQQGMRRGLGTTLAYLIMFALMFLVGAILLSPTIGFSNQMHNLIASLPAYVNQITVWANEQYAQYADILQNEIIKEWVDEASNALTAAASQFARDSATNVIVISTGFASGLMSFGFALVVAFWLLMELPGLGKECLRLGGVRRRDDLIMLHVTLSRVMGGYIRGTLLQCFLIGIASGIAFAIIDLPNYAALAAVVGLINIIPVIGPWIGGIAVSLVGLFVSPWVGFITFITIIIIQQFVYTFISPKIMSNSVDVHPALIILALMAGSALGGAMNGLVGAIVGMLASIPLVAIFKSIFVYYFEKRTGRKIVSPDGVFFKGDSIDGTFDPFVDAVAPHFNNDGEIASEKNMLRKFKRLRNRVK